jgi:hypothetical protein
MEDPERSHHLISSAPLDPGSVNKRRGEILKASAFSQALLYHLEWKRRFRNFLDGKGDMAASEIVSPEKWRLGKWLSSPEMSTYSSPSEIQELQRLHNEVHETAKRIYEFKRAGNLSASRRELKDFDDTCMKLVSLLTAKNVLNVSPKEGLSVSVMNLLNNFLFRKGFFDFFQKMERDGIEAAMAFWHSHPYKNSLPPQVPMIYEKLIDFYVDMSLIPQTSYKKLLKEQERLHYENTFLMGTFMELQWKVFAGSGEKVREAWQDALYEQIATNRGIAEKFFNLFVEASASFYGKAAEKPRCMTGNRREKRRTYDSPVEFVYKDNVDEIVKGLVINISDSGLCINSSIPLKKGQEILIRSSLPSRHKAFIVQWTNATITGFSAG